MREAFPEKKQKVEKLGVALFDEVSGFHSDVDKIIAIWKFKEAKLQIYIVQIETVDPYSPQRKIEKLNKIAKA